MVKLFPERALLGKMAECTQKQQDGMVAGLTAAKLTPEALAVTAEGID